MWTDLAGWCGDSHASTYPPVSNRGAQIQLKTDNSYQQMLMAQGIVENETDVNWGFLVYIFFDWRVASEKGTDLDGGIERKAIGLWRFSK